jgi:hypothetical protein
MRSRCVDIVNVEMIWCVIFLHVAFRSHRIVLNLVNYLKMSLWLWAIYQGLYTYLKCFYLLGIEILTWSQMKVSLWSADFLFGAKYLAWTGWNLDYTARKWRCIGIVLRASLFFSSVSSFISVLYSVFINPKFSNLTVEKHKTLSSLL